MTAPIKTASHEPKPFVWTGPPLTEARSLDRNCYVSPDFFRAEIDSVHARGWILVGRTEEWPAVGGYKAIDTIGGPALVLRDERGELRAFANFCRHRGAKLLEGSGVVRKILCPYHAWAYRLNGALLAAPSMEETTDFRAADWGLVPIRLETWEGFVFLNYSADAPSVRSDIGDLADLLASHNLGDMVCTWRKEIEFACNWKLLVENAMETYHTGTVHAATVGAQKSVTFAGVGEWMGMQVLSDKSIAVLNGDPPFKPIEGLSEQAKKGHVLHVPAPHHAVLLRAGLHVVAVAAPRRARPHGAGDRRLLPAQDRRTARVRAGRAALLQALGGGGAGGWRRAGEAANRDLLARVSAGAAVVARRPRAHVRPVGAEPHAARRPHDLKAAAQRAGAALRRPAGLSASGSVSRPNSES